MKKYRHYLSIEVDPCAVKEESSSGHFAFCTNDKVAYLKKVLLSSRMSFIFYLSVSGHMSNKIMYH